MDSFKKEQELKKKASLEVFGWYTDLAEPIDAEQGILNMHTVGVEQTYKHKDFQIVIYMPPNVAHMLFTMLVDRVKSGETIEVNKKYDDVLEDYDVYFVERAENGRNVLRMILPDKEGNFPEDEGYNPAFCNQLYEVLLH
ncbi:DUF4262 domain-containing protein [Bacillus toyonensis]|uniref:DUF4262 domain-containing protein n=1 Tax=Bacillus toyonensis TaxID=155322 RepID=UPI002E21FBD2|nr:DUF4262 domain-containing protein [Bacillus toyonensis]